MNSGENISKGSILFKEEKMSNTTLLLLIFAGFVSIFIIFFLTMYSCGKDPLMSTIWGLMFTFVFGLILIPSFYNRHYPLIIYERGFDTPLSVLKFLDYRERFIAFSRIKNIYPHYINIFGVSKLGGYSIITTEGRKVDITEIDENKLKTIEGILKSALKDQWDSLYINRPHIGFEELQQIMRQVTRSKKSVWVEGFVIISISFGFLIISLIQSVDTLLWLIAVPISFFGSLVGISRIASYYVALTNYEKAVKLDPSLEKIISDSMKIDIKKKGPLKAIEEFTSEDWKQLEMRINDIRPWYLILAGFLVMVVAMILQSAVWPILFTSIVFLGMGIMMSALLFIPRLTRDVELVKSLIEQELKDGKRTLPYWFRIRHRFMGMLPFREAPQYSDEQWKKFVRASKMKNEKRVTIVIIFLLLGIALSVILPRALNLPKYLGSVMLVIFMGTIGGYIFVSASRLGVLRAIETFEEQSRQKVIPEQYRSQIFKGWRVDFKK